MFFSVCPTFENGIAQGYGHLCVPTDGCFGLNCTIRIPDGIRKETVTLGVLFNRSDLTFTLFTTNYATEIAVDGNHEFLQLTLKILINTPWNLSTRTVVER